MDVNDKKRIQANLTTLTENVRVKDVKPYLIQDDVCTFDNYEEIEAEKTSQDKVLKLIEILQKKGPGSYQALCNALHKTGLEFIVDQLNTYNIPESESPKAPDPSPLLAQIQEELKEFYRRQLRYLSPIPWNDFTRLSLEKVFTSTQLVPRVQHHKILRAISGDADSKPVSMKDIFSSGDIRKVLVEGEPGIGKTTMTHKLAYDWAQGTAESGMEQFSGVFLLKAKDIHDGDTLQELLQKHLLPEDFNAENIMDCLREHQQHLLFIIDGFDEILDEQSHILKLISSKILAKSRVLVTSRPGFMSSHIRCFDSLLLNIGYSSCQQIEFATKFLQDITGEEGMEHFADFILKLKNDEFMKDLCRNPLHLSILCMLQIEYGKNVPKSKTALFEQMHEFVMKRACTKLNVSLEDFTLACQPLYKIAYQGLLEGRHRVTHDEILQHIDVKTVEHACFIAKDIQVSHFSPVVYYSFIHKSFQEYFAAVYIASKKGERVQYLRQIKHRSPYHMVTIFLCGLLKDDQKSLRDILEVVAEEIYLPTDPEVTFGIQFILENHNSHLILQCFSELSDVHELSDILPDNLEIGHVCFSLLWCTESCVDGMLTYLRTLDSVCACNGDCTRAVKVTMQMQCLEQRTGLYEKLLHAVSSFRHAGNLRVHHFMSRSQLVLLFSKLKEKPSKQLHTLELDFLNVDDLTMTPEQLKSFTWVLFNIKALMLNECSSSGLLSQLLSLIMPYNQLECLKIFQSTFDEAAWKQLCTTLETMTKLKAFHFLKNSIHDEPEFYMNMLESIGQKTNLVELALSHLPTRRMVERRVSISPVSLGSTVHVFPALTNSLKSTQLTTLSICDTSLGEALLENLEVAICASTQLKHLELRANHIQDFRALDDVITALIKLPEFESLRLRGTELDETNIQKIVDLISESKTLKYLCTPAWLGSLDYLAAGLRKNHSLEGLELRNLQFHDAMIKNFAEAVAQHSHLRKLHLVCNRAAPVDMHELIKACTTNTRLQKLRLVNFGLDESHVQCVGEMLMRNVSIVSLDIRGNMFNLKDLSVLNDYLAKRPKLKFLNVSQSLATHLHPVVDQLLENVVMLKAELF